MSAVRSGTVLVVLAVLVVEVVVAVVVVAVLVVSAGCSRPVEVISGHDRRQVGTVQT